MQQVARHIRTILENRPRMELAPQGETRRRAGVLVPLYQKEGEIHLLFGRRSGGVAHHKHQISFPGGLIDDGDRSIEDTVRRETFEEMGVEPNAIDIVGKLDDYFTVTNFLVTPLVGIIPYPYDFKISKREVAYLIEVPLPHVMQRRNLRVEYRLLPDGSRRELLFYDYQGEVIWGATAAMLAQFLTAITPFAALLGVTAS